MTIPDAAVQAALDVMRKYRYACDEEQGDHYVLVSGELMYPQFEGTMRQVDEWRTRQALAAAFPVMLREMANQMNEYDYPNQ